MLDQALFFVWNKLKNNLFCVVFKKAFQRRLIVGVDAVAKSAGVAVFGKIKAFVIVNSRYRAV